MFPSYDMLKGKVTGGSDIGLGKDLAIVHARALAAGLLGMGRKKWPGPNVADIK